MSVWFILLGVGAFLALLETVRREQMAAPSQQPQQTQAELFLSEDEPYRQYARHFSSVPTSQPGPSSTSTQNDVTASTASSGSGTAPTPMNGPYEQGTFASNAQPTVIGSEQSTQASAPVSAPTTGGFATGGTSTIG